MQKPDPDIDQLTYVINRIQTYLDAFTGGCDDGNGLDTDETGSRSAAICPTARDVRYSQVRRPAVLFDSAK